MGARRGLHSGHGRCVRRVGGGWPRWTLGRALVWALVWLRGALSLCSASALAAPHFADADVRSALAQGRTQAVIVQLADRAVVGEASAQRRTRRSEAKTRLLRDLSSATSAASDGPGKGASYHPGHDYAELPMLALTLKHPDALTGLLAHAEVAAVYADRPIKPIAEVSLTLVGQPPVASVMQRTGSGQTIAIIDTGVDYTQAAFGPCAAPNTGPGCKVVASHYTATGTAVPPAGAPLDALGHGTKVAQVALSVAPDARIAAVSVFTGSTASTSDVLAGLNWVLANRAAHNIVAVNMSLGDSVNHTTACTAANSAFYTPLRNVRNAGVVVVAASGNEGFTTGISGPACVADALAVGAVYNTTWGQVTWGACTDVSTAADQIACFSNSSSLLDVLAPGALFVFGGSYAGGTSFAAPMVAGAVAVLKAQFPAEAPSAMEARILNSGALLTDPRNGVSRPRLDLLAAQGAPSNDSFAARSPLSGNSVSASGWNYNASLQASEPSATGVSGGHSVWWAWTASSSGRLQVSTAGSAIDTVLAVYAGSTVSALTPLAANDDDGSAGGLSSLGLDVVAGTSYAIQVDGKSGAQGALSVGLSWSAASADLAVSIAALPGPITAGVPFALDATVVNTGPSTAAATVATFTWPAALAWVSGPPSCVPNGLSVTCNLGSMAPGSAALSVQLMAQSAGSASVGLTVSSTTAETNPSNNSTTLALTAMPNAAVEGDVPVPPWALGLLGLGLMGGLARRR